MTQIEGWPAVRIEVASRKEVYVLPWSAFPAALKQDVDGWLLRLSGMISRRTDLLSPPGPARSPPASTNFGPSPRRSCTGALIRSR